VDLRSLIFLNKMEKIEFNFFLFLDSSLLLSCCSCYLLCLKDFLKSGVLSEDLNINMI